MLDFKFVPQINTSLMITENILYQNRPRKRMQYAIKEKGPDKNIRPRRKKEVMDYL
jgi:hypothetical protein